MMRQKSAKQMRIKIKTQTIAVHALKNIFNFKVVTLREINKIDFHTSFTKKWKKKFPY